MKIKIAKVITSCHDCDNCKTMKSSKDNFTRAFICHLESNNKEQMTQSFLLHYTQSGGNHELEIPENCPLEDYKEINP